MKRWSIFLLFVVLLFELMLGVTGTLAKPANEPPPFPTYVSILYPCKYDDSLKGDWMSGKVIHVRNSIGISYGTSEDPNFDVETVETLSWNFNTNTGTGSLWGPYTQTYSNDNYDEDGLWVGLIEGSIYMSEDGTTPLAAGKGVFDGAGLFEGLRMRSTWSQEVISEAERTEACGFPPNLVNDPPLVKTTVKHFVIGEWPPDN